MQAIVIYRSSVADIKRSRSPLSPRDILCLERIPQPGSHRRTDIEPPTQVRLPLICFYFSDRTPLQLTGQTVS